MNNGRTKYVRKARKKLVAAYDLEENTSYVDLVREYRKRNPNDIIEVAGDLSERHVAIEMVRAIAFHKAICR